MATVTQGSGTAGHDTSAPEGLDDGRRGHGAASLISTPLLDVYPYGYMISVNGTSSDDDGRV